MKYVPKSVTRAIGKQVLKSKVHAPQILFVAGLGAVVSGTVLACKATLGVEKVLLDHEKDMLEIGHLEKRTAFNTDNATEKQLQRDRQHVTLRTTGRIMKLYAPAAVTMTVGIVCLTKSHRILTERNATLTAAYVGLQRFLEGYRGRVREKVGEAEEKELYYASTPVELVEDTPNGPKKVFGSSPVGSSPYSCVIDDSKKGVFQDSLDFNRQYVRIQERNLTDKLRAQGYLFLNDCYTRFDVSHTATGQICGWFVGHDSSDDYVEITVTPIHDGRGSIMLDFNVAGNVFEMLEGGDESDHPFTKQLLPARRGNS